MSVEAKWINDEKTILEFSYLKGWTWDDYFSALDISHEMVTAQSHTVYALSNFNQTTFPAKYKNALTKWQVAEGRQVPASNLAVVVSFGLTPFAKYLSRLYLKFARTPIRFVIVDNREAALQEIHKIMEKENL